MPLGAAIFTPSQRAECAQLESVLLVHGGNVPIPLTRPPVALSAGFALPNLLLSAMGNTDVLLQRLA